MLELPIDLSDVSIKGSTSSINKTEEIISKFQVVLDYRKMAYDAYMECTNIQNCSSGLANFTQIFNGLNEYYIEFANIHRRHDDSYLSAEYDAEAERMYQVSLNGTDE